MKIIQTLWTAPFQGVSPTNVRCGWGSPFHHWAGWLYSAHRAKQTYGNVHLVTDSLGAKTLADTFGIPYDSVTVALDNLTINPHLFNYGKFVAYSLQAEPFLHLDADAFLFRQLDDVYHSAPVVVQHTDNEQTSFWRGYGEGNAAVESMGWTYGNTPAYSMGIFGGNDVDAIHVYAQTALRFIDDNRSQIDQCTELELHSAARVIEGKIAYAFFNERKTNVVPLVRPDEWTDKDAVANQRGFSHLMSRKQLPNVCARLIERMKEECPQSLQRVHDYFGSPQANGPNKVYAVATVYDSPQIVPHFINHYAKLGVDRILIVSHVSIPNRAQLEKTYPVTFEEVPPTTFNNDDKARGELLLMQAVNVKPNDWVMHLDVDEFQQYPTALKTLIRAMENNGIDAVEGKLLDRVATDGVLHPINDSPLDDQFPLQCQLTKKLRGTLPKVMLSRFRVTLGSGRHMTLDGTPTNRRPIGTPDDYSVHHFRWTDGLVERLVSRFQRFADHYPDRKYPAANLEFCAAYRRSGRIDLTDPSLWVSPARRLSYPSTNVAAELLATLPPNGYAIDDSDSAVLSAFAKSGVRRVLEFGPGRSTLVWAFYGIEVDALEYDADEAERLTYLFAPLPNVRVQRHDLPITTRVRHGRYDLAFVDGPASRHYPDGFTRLDAVVYAASLADTVLLHDANRAGEKQTLAQMERMGYGVRLIQTNRGLAVITKKG